MGSVRVAADDVKPLLAVARGYEKWCGTEPLDLGAYRVDPATRGLAGAFVWVEGPAAEFRLDATPVLDQRKCVYVPPLVVMPPGDLVIRNSDDMPHNTTLDGAANAGVSVNLPAGRSETVRLMFDERLRARCSIHPWMIASVVVTRTRAHAVTDEAGRFRIEGAPAGRRKLHVWHAMGPEVVVDVDVASDGVVEPPAIEWTPRSNFRAPFGR